MVRLDQGSDLPLSLGIKGTGASSLDSFCLVRVPGTTVARERSEVWGEINRSIHPDLHPAVFDASIIMGVGSHWQVVAYTKRIFNGYVMVAQGAADFHGPQL